MWEIFMSGMCKCRNVVKVCQLLRATVRKNQAKSWFRGKNSKIDFFNLAFSSRSAKRSEFVISSRAKQKRAQCLDQACILASCKFAAFIFTCVYPGRIEVGRWNERVRAKRCDAVDWDQIMDYCLKRQQTTASCEDQGDIKGISGKWVMNLKGFVNR